LQLCMPRRRRWSRRKPHTGERLERREPRLDFRQLWKAHDSPARRPTLPHRTARIAGCLRCRRQVQPSSVGRCQPARQRFPVQRSIRGGPRWESGKVDKS
jgi:hypothetical protein